MAKTDYGLIEKDIQAIIEAGGSDSDVENYLQSSGVEYSESSGKTSENTNRTEVPRHSLGKQLLQSTINLPNTVMRGMAEPLVKAVGSAGLGINDLLNLRGKEVQGYDVPFVGGSIPVRRMESYPQAIGLGVQGGSLAIGANPALAGAAYAGGKAASDRESGMAIAAKTALGGALGYGAGVATGRYNIGADSKKLVQEAGEIYRKVLQPTKSEISKIEIGKGKDINSLFELAAKEKLPIKMTADKRLDTTDALTVLQDKQSLIHKELNTQLIKDRTPRFNLTQIGNKAKDNLSKTIKNARELEIAKANIDEFINAEKARFGNKLLNGKELNDVKQGMWSVSYNKFDPVQNAKAEAARTIGNVAKNSIEKVYSKSKVGELNGLSGDYSTLQRLLENANARTIRGGRFANYAGRIIGGMAGAATRKPVIGTAIGQEAGGRITDLLSNPDIATKFAQWKMSRALK